MGNEQQSGSGGMILAVISRLRALRRDRRGNIAMIFALTILPFLALTGFAIDYNRTVSFKTGLQNAADQAALAGAKDYLASIGLPNDQRATRAVAVATQYFNAQLAKIHETGAFTLAKDYPKYTITSDAQVDVKAQGYLRTTIGALAGVDQVGLAVEARAETGALLTQEIALVLDNTGSLRNDIQAVRDAANGLVDAVVQNAPPGFVKVAVVPFDTAVNVGSTFPTQYLDTTADNSTHGTWFENRDVAQLVNCANKPTLPAGYSFRQQGTTCFIVSPSKVNIFTLFSSFKNASWKGCVETLPEPYDVQDVTPTGDPNTKFVPYFWPDAATLDAPGNQLIAGASSAVVTLTDGRNSYLSDTANYWSTTGSTPVRHLNRLTTSGVAALTAAQRMQYQSFNILKYNNATASPIADSGTPIPPLGTGYTSTGPNANCPTQLLPLTTDFTTVHARINSMVAWNNGGTNTQAGLSWGWKVLSPRAPFTEGLPPDQSRKFLVLMTDGANEIVTSGHFTATGAPTLSDYNGLGFLRDNRSGATTDTQLVSYVDSRFALTCTNAKAEGITIYTILFRVPQLSAQYTACASSPSNAFVAANQAELINVFAQIGQSIRSLRLSK